VQNIFNKVVTCGSSMPQKLHSKIEEFVINSVKEKRIAKGISQKELAYLLEVSVGFIGNLENPKYRAKYNLNHLNELSKIFNCSPKDFLPEKPI
jgi:transcriptional regulator with XRE-family HTH domain